MGELTIGEVARRTGLRPSALRYYEDARLLSPSGRVSGRRVYAEGVVHRVAFIRLAQDAGLRIAEIRTLLHGFDRKMPPPARWKALAEQKLPELDAVIARAEAMKRTLEEALACECPRIEDCHLVIERIGPRS